MLHKKICMLGSFGVGKTSLVARYVQGIFSEKYLSTIGVKVDRKELQIGDAALRLLVWDLHGDDDFQRVQPSYLRGMSGYFLVADGTRVETLDAARELQQLARQTVGDVPFVLLLNKIDLTEDWNVRQEDLAWFTAEGWELRRTSAKTSESVGESFMHLAQRILATSQA